MNDNQMKISDEQLSAFLDAELPDVEMEMIREQLVEDEGLADRLADLAMVDQVIVAAYSGIDARALPGPVTRLLAEDTPNSAQVIQFPLLKKMQKNIQAYVAVAASVALVFGFGITQLATQEQSQWQSVAQILERTASGVEMAANDGARIKPRATFIDNLGNYCRQFSIQDKEIASENIACRKNNEWQLATSVAVAKTERDNDYQTASGGSVLDEQIETMAASDFFDVQTEAEAINQRWASKK